MPFRTGRSTQGKCYSEAEDAGGVEPRVSSGLDGEVPLAPCCSEAGRGLGGGWGVQVETPGEHISREGACVFR